MESGHVRVSKDASALNAIVNHPDVYPWVRGDIEGPLDLTAAVENSQNVLLLADHGAFLFIREDAGLYDVHTQFLKAGRPGALKAAKAAALYMFTQTDATCITTMVADNNLAAKALTRRMGFEHCGTGGEWPSESGPVPLNYYALTLKRWVTRTLCQQQ